jgi:hypothetical protein
LRRTAIVREDSPLSKFGFGPASNVQAQDLDNAPSVACPHLGSHRSGVSFDRAVSWQIRTTFEDLPSIIDPGCEVIVVDETGRKTRGRVSAISKDRVVVRYRRRLFRASEERALSNQIVTRIDIVDSTWNGALIGAAVAPVLVYGIHRWEDAAVPDSNSMKGLGTIVFGGISATLAVGIGHWIDRSMNRAIYERRGGTPGVTLAPWLEPTRRGIRAHVRF